MSRRPGPDAVREDFDKFVAASADQLLRAAYLVVWDQQEAEDLLQECYVQLARRWPRVRRMENPKAYARKILVNLALDGRRRRDRRRDELSCPGTVSPDCHLDQSASTPFSRIEELGTDLDRALGELSPRQRAVLVLRFFEDLSEAQAAETMGCSVGTVKSTTSRALERLRSVLGEQGFPGSGPAAEACIGIRSDAHHQDTLHVQHLDPERNLPL